MNSGYHHSRWDAAAVCRIMSVVILVVLAQCPFSFAGDPPPGKDELRDAETRIRMKGYLAAATQPFDTRLKKLTEAINRVQNDGSLSKPDQYALFNAIYREEILLGRLDLLVETIRVWREKFDVPEGSSLLSDGVQKLLAAPRAPAARAELVMAIVQKAKANCMADQWNDGLALVEMLRNSRLSNVIRDYVNTVETEIVEGIRRWESIAANAEKRKASPPDPDAQAEYAKYLIFVKYDVKAGREALPAANVDEVIATFRADTDPNTRPEQLMALAEKWLELAKTDNRAERNWFLDRALLMARRALRSQPFPDLKKFELIRSERTKVYDKEGAAFFARRPLDAVPFNGHWYKIFPEVLTWDEAAEACERMGGYLLCAETAEENAFIGSMQVNSIPADVSVAFWLGASDRGAEGTFLWLSLKPFRNAAARFDVPDREGRSAEQDYLYASWSAKDKKMAWGDIAADGFVGLSQITNFSITTKMYYVCEWEQ